uniref:Protein-serine/threonine phosphatase n=1 Tax=Panagrolaimus sp. JU765 TaxID=591449 RepID=A0AC34RMP4_9BILA
MHGGLSPSATLIDEIQQIDRIKEVPLSGPSCDLLWSDPHDDPGWSPSTRGCGHFFGEDVSEAFHFLNQTTSIVRAHQVVMTGYQLCHKQQVLTVFSAPNYCYRLKNMGAALFLENCDSFRYIQFDGVASNGKMPKNDRPVIFDKYFD